MFQELFVVFADMGHRSDANNRRTLTVKTVEREHGNEVVFSRAKMAANCEFNQPTSNG